jgi:REP element-mobilizing transposase RayT
LKISKDQPKRKILRLKDFDYTTEGAYFVTICTRNMEDYFGKVIYEEMILNKSGQMIEEWWKKLEKKYEEIILDEYIIMPNHLHGVLMIIRDKPVGTDPRVRPDNKDKPVGADLRVRPNPSLSDFIKWFKTMTTNHYIRNVKVENWKPFDKKLWQRSFYERIIRNEKDLNNIREYIINNPLKWEWEKGHVHNI